MDEKTKVIELNGKRVIFNTMPATVGYSVAMRMRVALADDTNEQSAKIMQDCLYAMLKYCKLALEDGREVALDNESFINQHFTSQELIDLQSQLLHFNFGFLMKGDH
jgi:hypothetical protein